MLDSADDKRDGSKKSQQCGKPNHRLGNKWRLLYGDKQRTPIETKHGRKPENNSRNHRREEKRPQPAKPHEICKQNNNQSTKRWRHGLIVVSDPSNSNDLRNNAPFVQPIKISEVEQRTEGLVVRQTC